MNGIEEYGYKNPILKRILLRANLVFETPALIGSGESENTDSDVLRDSSGMPFLPGTAFAGVLRHQIVDKDAKILFGDSDDNGAMSSLWVLDAPITSSAGGTAEIVTLDGVAIDPETRLAIAQRKYDLEAIAKGNVFTARIMLVLRESDDALHLECLLDQVASTLLSGEIRVGAKTNRGFGKLRCDTLDRQEFDFEKEGKDALLRWADFGWDKNSAWKPYAPNTVAFESDFHTLVAKLKLDGSIMIRDCHPEGEEDYRHISAGGVPVIFGTSWAGAIRSGLHRLLKPLWGEETQQKLDAHFGCETNNDGQKDTIPSKLIFDASFLDADNAQVEGYRTITRVKINRFTGGAADGALFTECPWVGGSTKLVVRWPRGESQSKDKELLLFALDAMDKGILNVGGESAIGRGFFKVEGVEIDGEKAWEGGETA
jgi:CRISPR/Cas system CMR subunit Cmr4 (Cas7 group RAMP superfamily)